MVYGYLEYYSVLLSLVEKSRVNIQKEKNKTINAYLIKQYKHIHVERIYLLENVFNQHKY